MSSDDGESENTGIWKRIINGVEMVIEGVRTVGFLLKAVFNVFD